MSQIYCCRSQEAELLLMGFAVQFGQRRRAGHESHGGRRRKEHYLVLLLRAEPWLFHPVFLFLEAQKSSERVFETELV